MGPVRALLRLRMKLIMGATPHEAASYVLGMLGGAIFLVLFRSARLTILDGFPTRLAIAGWAVMALVGEASFLGPWPQGRSAAFGYRSLPAGFRHLATTALLMWSATLLAAVAACLLLSSIAPNSIAPMSLGDGAVILGHGLATLVPMLLALIWSATHPSTWLKIPLMSQVMPAMIVVMVSPLIGQVTPWIASLAAGAALYALSRIPAPRRWRALSSSPRLPHAASPWWRRSLLFRTTWRPILMSLAALIGFSVLLDWAMFTSMKHATARTFNPNPWPAFCGGLIVVLSSRVSQDVRPVLARLPVHPSQVIARAAAAGALLAALLGTLAFVLAASTHIDAGDPVTPRTTAVLYGVAVFALVFVAQIQRVLPIARTWLFGPVWLFFTFGLGRGVVFRFTEGLGPLHRASVTTLVCCAIGTLGVVIAARSARYASPRAAVSWWR